MEMHKDFYSHLVVLTLERPLKSKAQLSVQQGGLTCPNDLLDYNRGFLNVPFPYDDDQCILKKKKKKKV